MIKIGYVILTWNSEKVIKKCIDSILNIAAFSADIVVADNGSTDKTVEILESYSIQEPHSLELIRYPENRGTTIPRNAAIKELMSHNADYYCILDSDTIINEDAVSHMADFLHNNKKCGIVGPRMVTSDNIVQVSGRCFPTLTEKICKAVPIKAIQALGESKEEIVPRDVRSGAYPVDYLMSACWMMPSEVIHTVGMLDENIFYAPEDAEYCIRVWKSGYRVVYYPEAQIVHEWQRLSKKKMFSRINYEHIKGLIYMFRKHRYIFSAKKLKKSFPENISKDSKA